MLLLVGCGPTPEPGDPPEGWTVPDRPDAVVRVEDPQGGAVAGAWLTLSPGGRDVQTDADGAATFVDLVPDTYGVRIAAPGHRTLQATLAVPDDADLSATWVVEPLAATTTLRGTVRDAQGAPLFSARVRLDGAVVATTDLDGTFEVTGVEPGRHRLVVDAPGRRAGTWSTDTLDVQAEVVRLAIDLPGTIPDSARPIGSQACATCHADAAAAWSSTAHAQAGRAPDALADHPLAEAFREGRTVDLGLGGATATLDATGGWRVTLAGGGSQAIYRVVEVYGGHGPGAALVGVDGEGQRVLLPVGWAAAGQGVHPDLGATVLPAWTEGWTDGGALDLDPDPAAVSFDLRCAGCHATGARLTEAADGWDLARVAEPPIEPVVGCEACHGDGSIHRRDLSRRATNIVHPAKMDGDGQIEVCARCHGAVTSEDHPFSATPGWPVTPEGRLPDPDALGAHAVLARDAFAGVRASRVLADQAGDLSASPHREGTLGYEGACGDCHVAHGSEHPADLHADPLDNALCTGCHGDLDGIADQGAHAGHQRFAPGLWSPGACVTCHMPRTAAVVRRDPLSGVGEQRAHTLGTFPPSQVLTVFDEAGADRLSPGEVPVPGCLDCHLQAAEILDARGVPFKGPLGDPYLRQSYLGLSLSYQALWGVE